jgi:hypothetical protein
MGDTAKVQALIAAGADLNLQAMVCEFNLRHRMRHVRASHSFVSGVYQTWICCAVTRTVTFV